MKLITILLMLLFIYSCCSCPEPDYTGWIRVDNPYYVDSSSDTLFISTDGLYWIGKFEGRYFMVHDSLCEELFDSSK